MDTFNFSLIVTPPTVDEETAADKLFEAGCGDATFSVSNGVYEIEFDREARSLHDAVFSAIDQVSRAGIGSRVVRVVPDDLVHANAIAKRSGKTRQAVSLWIAGERGRGFPAPRAIVGESPVWSWVRVAEWLFSRGEIEKDAVDAAKLVAEVNRDLERQDLQTGAEGQQISQ